MLKRFGVVVSGAVLCAAVSAPAWAQDTSKPADTKVVIKDDTTPKVKKAGQDMSDASVTAAVKTRIAKDEMAKKADVDVDTKDGVVTLHGTVASATEKTHIGALARRTTGVKRVDNDLTVSAETAGTTGTTAKAKDKVDDSKGVDIKVKNDLPKVKVKNDLPNVKVKDDTTPAAKSAGRKIEDGAILTDLKAKLIGATDVSADHIDVDVKNGIVTLKGTVPDSAQRARATEIAHNTAGVKRVVNTLTVK